MAQAFPITATLTVDQVVKMMLRQHAKTVKVTIERIAIYVVSTAVLVAFFLIASGRLPTTVLFALGMVPGLALILGQDALAKRRNRLAIAEKFGRCTEIRYDLSVEAEGFVITQNELRSATPWQSIVEVVVNSDDIEVRTRGAPITLGKELFDSEFPMVELADELHRRATAFHSN